MFTEAQIKEIAHVKELIVTLSRMQDRIYHQLINDLEFSRYIEDKKETEYSGKEHLNPETYLFDLIYNSAEDLIEGLKLVEQKMHEYSLS